MNRHNRLLATSLLLLATTLPQPTASKRKAKIVSEYFNTDSGDVTQGGTIPWPCALKCLNNLASCGGWDKDCKTLERKIADDPQRHPAPGEYLRPEDYREKTLTCRSVKCKFEAPCQAALPSVESRKSYKCNCKCGTCGDRCENMHFTKFAQRGITAHNLAELQKADADSCLEACIREPRCRSVDYASKDRTCFVNSDTHLTPGVTLKIYRHVDYYFHNCTCPETE